MAKNIVLFGTIYNQLNGYKIMNEEIKKFLSSTIMNKLIYFWSGFGCFLLAESCLKF